MTKRTTAAWVLFIGAGAVTLGVLAAAAIGGVGRYPGFSITSSKPLRFALAAAFIGWFVLPLTQRERVAARLSPHRARLLVGALAFAVLWAVAHKLTRWLALKNGALDMSLFESTLLNTLDGRFVYAWGLGRSLFSEHLEPMVLLFLPLYAVFKSPLVLMLPQALAVTLAVVPLYHCARALKLPPHLCAFTGAAYLLNANVHRSNLMDFHPELFAPLVVFWALYASLSRRWLQLYAALLFAFMLKEEMALVMLCFAVLVLRGGGGRRWPHALAVAVLSVAWGVFAFKVAMPMSHPEGVTFHPLAGRWSHLGATYPEMALGLLSRPTWVIGLFLKPAPLELFYSLGGLPLLDPLCVLAAVPPLLGHLSGAYETASKLAAYYGLLGNTYLIAAVPFALAFLQRRFGPRPALVGAMLAVAAAPTVPFMARVTAADLHAAAFIAAIPADAVVCAQSALAPHRPPTERLLMAPTCGEAPDWILLGTEHDPWPLTHEQYPAWVAEQRQRPGYEVAFAQGDYVFLKRLPDP